MVTAGVQPPALYRHFGDLRGLLDAVARDTYAAYVREKAAHDRADARADDPVEALRRGWDRHVAFGLAHPEVYALIYGDPTAEAGRLRVRVPHAVRLLAAAGNGVTLALIAAPPALRAVLAEAPDALTAGERQLLGEWLDRLADDRAPDRRPAAED